MLLYIIRHGDPDYEHDCLTPLGQRQAEAVGRRLCNAGITHIYTSPMGRARETAQPLQELLGQKAEISEWLSEDKAWQDLALQVGDKKNFIYNMIPGYRFKSDELLHATGAEFDSLPIANGISTANAFSRVANGSDALLATHGYRRISESVYALEPGSEDRLAVFCHEGASMIWLSLLTGIAPHILWSTFAYTHTGVTLLRFEEQTDFTAPKCLLLSDTAHLYAAHLPMKYTNCWDI